jgi:2-oxo-4-hydroxy-4-carboxy-5-ureidoimidazoline decarboxylase
LALLNQRLPNERVVELKNAAAEQAKITAIRINKLIPNG